MDASHNIGKSSYKNVKYFLKIWVQQNSQEAYQNFFNYRIIAQC